MQTQQTPQVLQQPFAAQGDKNTIPNAATGTNKASLQEGFPPITGQPINQGGIPPERADFNGAMNLNSQFYFAFQNGWLPTFSQDVSDAIGGYPQGAVLWLFDTENNVYTPLLSLVGNNTYNFNTNKDYIGQYWAKILPDIQNKITNCITKIPQDIKFELSSAGVLTLKAGSKAWYPNGKDSDGTLLFGSAVTANDISWAIPDNANYENLFVFLGSNRTAAAFRPADSTHSGSSDPGTTSTTYYNTSENYIDAHDSAGLDRGLTFPLAIVKAEAGKVTQINQVFNGFGYIGQVLYALPGVEGLSPDGRNADGSLKNELMTLDHVVTRDYTWYCAEGQYVFLGISQEYGDDFSLISTTSPGMYKQQSTPPDLGKYITWHRLDENKLYRTEALSVTPNWVPMRGFAVGLVFNTGEGTNVSSWNIARPVAMLDMSNTSYMSKMGMPSDRYVDLTLGATSSDYIAPANGYVQLSQQGSSSNNAVSLLNLSTEIQQTSKSTTGTNDVFLPVISGDKFRIFYLGESSSIIRFRFIYAEGDK